jgi:lipopolysaccharide transport system permease protein
VTEAEDPARRARHPWNKPNYDAGMATHVEAQPLDRHQGPEYTVWIEPTRGVSAGQLRELWRYRELLYFLTWRDIKVRYKQTVLGIAWAVLVPVLSVVLFTIVFGHVAHVSSQGVPYPIFSYAGLLPWNLAAGTLQLATASVVGSAQLMTKVYFPRLFIAVSPALASVVDFAIGFLVLVGMMAYYDIAPDPVGVFLLPVFLLLALITTVGVSAFLSALNIEYRDVRFIVPFFIQFWFFATPVVYSTASLDEPWKTVYGLNPMVGVVEGFRWALAGTPAPGWSTSLVSAGAALTAFAAGAYYFLKTERRFADVI